MNVRLYPLFLLTAALVSVPSLSPTASASATTTGPTTYTLTDIGTLGGANSYAYAINNAGVVVGKSETGTTTHAFRYTSSLTDLGTLPAPYDYYSAAYAINANGQIVGTSGRSGGVSRHAFRTAAGGAVTGALDLGALGSTDTNQGPDDSEALAINGSGVTVGDSFPAYGQTFQPIRYDTSLSTAPPSTGIADGINDSGLYVGFTYYSYGFDNRQVAYLANSGGSLTYLGPTSSTSGGPNSVATAINNSGLVAGYLDYSDSGFGYSNLSHAFLYDSTRGTTTDLGTTPFADTSRALAINGTGAVVGNAGGGSFQHAVLFQSGKAYDLNDLLAVSNSGFVVVSATGINDGGKIVGFGTVGGNFHAFLLTSTGTPAQPPAAPSGVSAALTSDPHTIAVSFTDNSGGRALTVVERQTGTGAFVQVGVAPSGSTTFNDSSSVMPGQTYTYRVKARNSVGDSAYAYSSPITTPPPATDVSATVRVTRTGFRYNHSNGQFAQTLTLTNTGSSSVTGPVSLVLDNLQANLVNTPDGATSATSPAGSPYFNVTPGALAPGAKATVILQFTQKTQTTGDGEGGGITTTLPITYTTRVLAGTGTR